MKHILKRIFKNQEISVSKEWAESRKEALKSVNEMAERQNNLSSEQVRKEAMLQAEKMRNQRKERKNEK